MTDVHEKLISQILNCKTAHNVKPQNRANEMFKANIKREKYSDDMTVGVKKIKLNKLFFHPYNTFSNKRIYRFGILLSSGTYIPSILLLRSMTG